MEEMKITPVNYAMQVGIYLGLIGVVKFLLLAYSLDYPTIALVYLLVALLFHFFVYKYVRTFRDTVLDGRISFFQAWNVSLLCYFFSSILSGAVEFVFYRFIKPDFLINYIPRSIQALKEVSDQVQNPTFRTLSLDLSKQIAQSGVPSPIEMVFSHIQNSIFSGIFVSLIIAAIVIRNKNKNLSPSNN